MRCLQSVEIQTIHPTELIIVDSSDIPVMSDEAVALLCDHIKHNKTDVIYLHTAHRCISSEEPAPSILCALGNGPRDLGHRCMFTDLGISQADLADSDPCNCRFGHIQSLR